MANLDDLGIPSISDMTTDEALEHIRQMRLRRRTHEKKTKQEKSTKPKTKKSSPQLDLTALDSDSKANLISILEGMLDD